MNFKSKKAVIAAEVDSNILFAFELLVLLANRLCHSVIIRDDSRVDSERPSNLEEPFESQGVNRDYFDTLLQGEDIVLLEEGLLNDQLIRRTFNKDGALCEYHPKRVITR